VIRSFVALTLPDEIKRNLATISQKLSRMGLDGSFPKPDAMHLTLKFLGNIPENQVEAIEEALRRASARIPVLQLKCRGVGAFPNADFPRVVWAGIETVPELSILHRRVDEELATLGFLPEDRPFSPHLTLVRLKGRTNIRLLKEYLKDSAIREEAGSFSASEIHLFQSELRPDGARYTKLRSVGLGSLPEA